jgi:soluble lytic murein transglycosylase-like protein
MGSKPLKAALLLVAALLPAVAVADTRQLVTLRSGFQIEADRLEFHEDSLILHTNGGEIRITLAELAAVSALVAEPEDTSAPGLTTEEVTASQPPPVLDLIRAAAERLGLPEAFVRSVAEAESALQPGALSPKGARGVMQLMPATAEELGVDPDDPAENVEGGARLLRALLLRYQHEPDQVRRALAAYNAGPGTVEKYKGVPPYQETQRYIERVLRRYQANAAK